MNLIHVTTLVSIYCIQQSRSGITCPPGHVLQTATTGHDVCVQCQTGATHLPATNTVPVCRDGQYIYNISDGTFVCQQWINVTSSLETNNITGNDNITQVCQTPIHSEHHGQFRVYSILLFTLAILVDILYVFLYSRNFLKRNSRYFSRRDSRTAERVSRMIGTVGINLHVVFFFVHSFGILCEVGVVHMDEDTLWIFTISVGLTSLLFYFADAILFVVVKRMVVLPACCFRRDQNTRANMNTNTDDAAQVILQWTEV